MSSASPDVAALDEELSRPTPPLIEAMARLDGDLLLLGAGGKMGPTLARMARRAWDESGLRHRVIAVSRFGERRQRHALEDAGVETVAADLFDPDTLTELPDAPNVIHMVGRKFGTAEDAAGTWGVNAWLSGTVARRFRHARIVAFSTGNVYPLTDVKGPGPSEHFAVGPVGEYAQSALARERVLEFFSQEYGTPMAFLRLNYAVEPRYGVLRDIADALMAEQPIDLTMGYVNVIWQREANAIALRAFELVATPPAILNVTGRPAVAVRDIAEGLARRLGVTARFTGTEAPTALLSDASRCETLFGKSAITLELMLDRVADWVAAGGESLGKPTHFDERSGSF